MTMNPEALKKIVCFKCNQNGAPLSHSTYALDAIADLSVDLGHFGEAHFAVPLPLCSIQCCSVLTVTPTANNCNNAAVPGQRGGVER